MADIKYLAGLDIDGNINLNTNQLQFAVIQPDTSDPTAQTPQVGQIYYKSDTQALRVYSGATNGWISVGQDSNDYVDGGSYSGGTLTLTRTGSLIDIPITGFLEIGTTSTTALAGNTRTITSGEITKLGNITITQAVDLDTMEQDVSTNNAKNSYPTADATKVGFITITQAVDLDTMEQDVSDNNDKISFPGFGTTSGTALEGDTVIPAAANNGTLTIATSGIASGGGTFSADQSSNNTITITATEADTLATVTARGATTSTAVTFGAVDMLGDLDMNSGQIINLADPTTAQDAATKNYVDSAVTGQLIYQGGYNASVAPPTGSSILKGFTYTVTTAGDGNGFFTTELEIGDLIIAESDNPTTEADWTEVNKNVDLATTTTVGVASFSSSNFAVSSAGEVTVKNDGIILGTETTGNYVGSLSAGTNITISNASSEGGTPTISMPSANIDTRITNRQYAGLIGNGTLTDIPVTAATHGLGSDSTQFMIQLIEVSSGETVFAEVTRGASGLVTVGFTSAPASNSIRILIQKIG